MKSSFCSLLVSILTFSSLSLAQAPASKPISYDPVNLSESVARIDIKDDKAIIKAAGVPVNRTTSSTDDKGEPKKIHVFGTGSLTLQIELSRTQIIIGWIAANDTDEALTKGIKNVKIAQRLARSLLGIDGGRLVDRVMTGYTLRGDTLIEGYRVSSASCAGGSVCLIKIHR
ncbi:MAG: hypothetical protein WAT36_14165 [Chromatiaceae bacterium]